MYAEIILVLNKNSNTIKTKKMLQNQIVLKKHVFSNFIKNQSKNMSFALIKCYLSIYFTYNNINTPFSNLHIDCCHSCFENMWFAKKLNPTTKNSGLNLRAMAGAIRAKFQI